MSNGKPGGSTRDGWVDDFELDERKTTTTALEKPLIPRSGVGYEVEDDDFVEFARPSKPQGVAAGTKPFDLTKRYEPSSLYSTLASSVAGLAGTALEAKDSTVVDPLVLEREGHKAIVACSDASAKRTAVTPPATDRVPGKDASEKDKQEFVKDGGLSIGDALKQAKDFGDNPKRVIVPIAQSNPIRIFGIPTPFKRAHWTALEVDIDAEGKATATHVDSIDKWTSRGYDLSPVEKALKEAFPEQDVPLQKEYTGKQQDGYNCGRFVATEIAQSIQQGKPLAVAAKENDITGKQTETVTKPRFSFKVFGKEFNIGSKEVPKYENFTAVDANFAQYHNNNCAASLHATVQQTAEAAKGKGESREPEATVKPITPELLKEAMNAVGSPKPTTADIAQSQQRQATQAQAAANGR